MALELELVFRGDTHEDIWNGVRAAAASLNGGTAVPAATFPPQTQAATPTPAPAAGGKRGGKRADAAQTAPAGTMPAGFGTPAAQPASPIGLVPNAAPAAPAQPAAPAAGAPAVSREQVRAAMDAVVAANKDKGPQILVAMQEKVFEVSGGTTRNLTELPESLYGAFIGALATLMPGYVPPAPAAPPNPFAGF